MKRSQLRLCLVDDDEGIRASLRLLTSDAGIPFTAFASGPEFLAADLSDVGCILLNERMPGMRGSEVQQELRKRGEVIPVIFLTGSADIPFVVRVVQAGAFDVIEKPFHEKSLLERVDSAFARSEQRRRVRAEKAIIAARLDRLTRRELEVLDLIVAGKKNKDIADELQISPKTLDIHRAKVIEKMEARTVADAVRWRLFSQSSEEHWPRGVGYLGEPASGAG
ncbi:MAG: response regulator [Gemmataceae bacterium]